MPRILSEAVTVAFSVGRVPTTGEGGHEGDHVRIDDADVGIGWSGRGSYNLFEVLTSIACQLEEIDGESALQSSRSERSLPRSLGLGTAFSLGVKPVVTGRQDHPTGGLLTAH